MLLYLATNDKLFNVHIRMRPVGRIIHEYDYGYGGRPKCTGEPFRDPDGNDHPLAVVTAGKPRHHKAG